MGLRQSWTVAPRAPESFAELSEAERLIVWAARRWLLGLHENSAEHWDLVWNAFARQFGARDGKAALSGLALLLRERLQAGRRPMLCHRPCCGLLSADEICVLGLVGACQRGDWPLARGLGEWMARPEGMGDLIEAGSRLAAVLHRHALELPKRGGPQALDQSVPDQSVPKNNEAVTIH